MNQLVFIENDRVVTDSLTVSEAFEKRHDRVLQDIRELGCSKEFRLHHFVESYYNNQQGRPTPKYFITQDGFTLLAMGYTGKKAMEFKEKYIAEFNRMKQQSNQPKTQLEILQSSINQLIEQEQKVKHLETQLTTVNHRLDNMDSIDTVGDLQQRLNKMIKRYAWQNGFNMGNAWKQFDQSFNIAFRTNLTSLRNNYSKKHGFEKLTRPQYLSLTNQLEDGLRVADKMLNQLSKGRRIQ